ncbi:16341_t:CDS:2 [Funneliformis geosporum]|uniref:8804_t:CDS:1 n=1 Tax=Funneliformis geosporum TaxID=1117311 RepID=A0A9W4SSW7_9GLOM|nr:8804_t:CDS:2 [Funneliformis geosporum]CAI2183077.1 16341_t:CDS:2 [Funneliformis geosporum]
MSNNSSRHYHSSFSPQVYSHNFHDSVEISRFNHQFISYNNDNMSSSSYVPHILTSTPTRRSSRYSFASNDYNTTTTTNSLPSPVHYSSSNVTSPYPFNTPYHATSNFNPNIPNTSIFSYDQFVVPLPSTTTTTVGDSFWNEAYRNLLPAIPLQNVTIPQPQFPKLSLSFDYLYQQEPPPQTSQPEPEPLHPPSQECQEPRESEKEKKDGSFKSTKNLAKELVAEMAIEELIKKQPDAFCVIEKSSEIMDNCRAKIFINNIINANADVGEEETPISISPPTSTVTTSIENNIIREELNEDNDVTSTYEESLEDSTEQSTSDNVSFSTPNTSSSSNEEDLNEDDENNDKDNSSEASDETIGTQDGIP